MPANKPAAAIATLNQITNATITASSTADMTGGPTWAPSLSTQMSIESPGFTVGCALTAPVCSAPAANHRARTVLCRFEQGCR